MGCSSHENRERLTPRGAAILDAVIEMFIDTCHPVGSQTIAAKLSERLSSATIRNVMADLDRSWYLQQPHASAGRIPTEKGYRSYVDRLLADGRLVAVDERPLRRKLEMKPAEVGRIMHRSCRLLAELSQLVAVVTAPSLAATGLKHIEFIRLDGQRLLTILVGSNGQVSSHVVEVSREFTQGRLVRLAGYLVRRFGGRPVGQVRQRILELLEDGRDAPYEDQKEALDLGARSLSGEFRSAEVFVEGASSLLRMPDFGRRESLQGLLATIQDREVLLDVWSDSADLSDPTVLIGDKLPHQLVGCTAVLATYRCGGRPVGRLGVLGPTRMQYSRAIAVVRAMAGATSTMITELNY